MVFSITVFPPSKITSQDAKYAIPASVPWSGALLAEGDSQHLRQESQEPLGENPRFCPENKKSEVDVVFFQVCFH